MPDDYDPYLGITPEERALVEPLHLAGRLSHFIEIDRDAQQVVTKGRDVETGITYVQRRRPFSEGEKKPWPFGFNYLEPPNK